jgi:DNA-binding protein WhiA
VAHHINYALLEEQCDRISFLRGAFLSGGSATDPGKGYHLELSTSHYSVSRELGALMRELGFEPKETTRKANYVTYFKSSAVIEDFLTTLGAPIQAMQIMEAKVEKQLRGGVNRRVNCDAANLDKTVEAAMEVIHAIQRLEERAMMDSLPEKLKEAALLRKENPEATLSELAAMCVPPVTKSAFNHRLKKLLSLAGEEN